MPDDARPFWFAVASLLDAIIIGLFIDVSKQLDLRFQMAGYVTIAVISIVVFQRIQSSGGRKPKAELQILCYAGYDEYIRKASTRIRQQLNIVCSSQSFMGEEIFVELLRFKPDILIFDIEHVDRLADCGENSLVPLEQLRQFSQAVPESSELLKIPVDSLIPRYKNAVMGFPIRFGTNSISYNNVHLGKHLPRSLKDLLFGDSEFTKRLYAEKRIGVWARESVLMGLISLCLGNHDPYNLTEDKFQELCSYLRRVKTGVKQSYFGTKGYARLRHDLNEGHIWLVLGGGEWHVDPSRKHFPHIDWMIPDEGALVWVESLGITRRCLEKVVDSDLNVGDLMRFVREFLLGEVAQAKLATEHLYIACPVNYDAALRPGNQDFSCFGFDKPGLKEMFEKGRLVLRSAPPETSTNGAVGKELWNQFWIAEFGSLVSHDD